MEPLSPRIVRRFDEELNAIRTKTLHMGSLAARQLENAVAAFIDGDSKRAESVLGLEPRINAFELEIDDDIACFIAKRQPAASDLRLILMLSKIARDLERIGDEAKKIARLAIRASEDGVLPRGSVELRSVDLTVRSMMEDAMNAVVRGNNALALDVLQRNADGEQKNREVNEQLVAYMTTNPRSIGHVMDMLRVFKGLERIGDHVSNIAKCVFYVSTGDDVRQLSADAMRGYVCAQDGLTGGAES